MADTKQVKTVGEHHAAAELARRGWAPAMIRDGLERTDILAVFTEGENRRMVEIQVKTARGPNMDNVSWVLGAKTQGLACTTRVFRDGRGAGRPDRAAA